MTLEDYGSEAVIGFIDPRAAKTNLLNHASALTFTLSGCTRGAAIVGPDGVTSDGYRITSGAANASFYGGPPQLDGLTNGARYTAGIYVRSSAGLRMGLGQGSAIGFNPIFYNALPIIPNYAEWTLYESEQLATSNYLLGQWYYWFGLNNSFSNGEWIEIARPMVYAGTKVS